MRSGFLGSAHDDDDDANDDASYSVFFACVCVGVRVLCVRVVRVYCVCAVWVVRLIACLLEFLAWQAHAREAPSKMA